MPAHGLNADQVERLTLKGRMMWEEAGESGAEPVVIDEVEGLDISGVTEPNVPGWRESFGAKDRHKFAGEGRACGLSSASLERGVGG